MKFGFLDWALLIMFIVIIILSIYFKNLSAIIGWSNALLWFLIANINRKPDVKRNEVGK